MEMESSLMDTSPSQTKPWLGNSISDMCRNQGFWSFSVSPVSPSKYHQVLYQMPPNLLSPPKPHITSNPMYWDEDHVRMPYSSENLYPVVQNGVDVLKSRWKLINEAFSKPIKTSEQLEQAIKTYNSVPNLSTLHHFFNEVLEEEETEQFFEHLLPAIVKLALQLPDIVPCSLPLLTGSHCKSVSLSQLQIASLLANAFLCTFPWRKDMAAKCPGVNFIRLLSLHHGKRQSCIDEKLKAVFHYFKRVTRKNPVGVVTFERKFIPRKNIPRWDTLDNNLGNTKIHITSEGTIEDDGLGFLQVDFANKNVGGGVLGRGCVQEEIRYVICPELIISRLFVETLNDTEALIVTGAERYSQYTGYGDTFKWDGNVQDGTPFDDYGRRRTTICVIDATHYNKPKDQYFSGAMLRELNKAYVGFHSREKDNLAPVATGNWGCGAFNGNPHLKSLLQLMACTAANRNFVYYSFGNEELRDDFYNIHTFFASHRITISQLWRFLCQFSTTTNAHDRLYAFIQQAYFDSKSQSTIKKFFGISSKCSETRPSPSTSSTKNVVNKDNKIVQSPKIDEVALSDTCVIDTLLDEDIIPPTPPEELALKQKTTKVKPKAKSEIVDNNMPRNHNEIVELIDIIDGNANKTKNFSTCDSFFSEIDKVRKNTKIKDKEERPRKTENSVEMMDVDEIIVEPSKPEKSQEEQKGAKRKITDYFVKSSNLSS